MSRVTRQDFDRIESAIAARVDVDLHARSLVDAVLADAVDPDIGASRLQQTLFESTWQRPAGDPLKTEAVVARARIDAWAIDGSGYGPARTWSHIHSLARELSPLAERGDESAAARMRDLDAASRSLIAPALRFIRAMPSVAQGISAAQDLAAFFPERRKAAYEALRAGAISHATLDEEDEFDLGFALAEGAPAGTAERMAGYDMLRSSLAALPLVEANGRIAEIAGSANMEMKTFAIAQRATLRKAAEESADPPAATAVQALGEALAQLEHSARLDDRDVTGALAAIRNPALENPAYLDMRMAAARAVRQTADLGVDWQLEAFRQELELLGEHARQAQPLRTATAAIELTSSLGLVRDNFRETRENDPRLGKIDAFQKIAGALIVDGLERAEPTASRDEMRDRLVWVAPYASQMGVGSKVILGTVAERVLDSETPAERAAGFRMGQAIAETAFAGSHALKLAARLMTPELAAIGAADPARLEQKLGGIAATAGPAFATWAQGQIRQLDAPHQAWRGVYRSPARRMMDVLHLAPQMNSVAAKSEDLRAAIRTRPDDAKSPAREL